MSLSPGMIYQHMQTEQDAQSTGGAAVYNNYGLAKIAAHIVSADARYYTLSYSPQAPRRNAKWHHVKVKLDDSRYHHSYRRAYYDDGSNNLPQPGKNITVLQCPST